jgi:hypothetical protein
MVLVKDMKSDVTCHDCGVKSGKPHKPGCDVEKCPKCGCQLISCDCFINGRFDFFFKIYFFVWINLHTFVRQNQKL